MALVRVSYPSDPPTAQADWTAINALMQMRFLYALGVVNWKKGDAIRKGTVLQIGGTVYYADSDTAISGSPSDYVEITPSGATASAAYVADLTGVTWSDEYNGYYDGDGHLHLFDESTAMINGQISEYMVTPPDVVRRAGDQDIGGVKGFIDPPIKAGQTGFQAGAGSDDVTTGAAVGAGASAVSGGAMGDGASATTGGAMGDGASATTGGAMGDGASATGGGAVGSGASTGTGGAMGSGASAGPGGAMGRNAAAESGGAVGDNTIATGGGAVGSGASANGSGRSAFGVNSTSTADNQIRIGTALQTIVDGSGGTITSDERDKIDISDNDLGLDFILKVPTKKFRRNPRELYFMREEPAEAVLDDNGNIVEPARPGGRLITDEKRRPLYDQEAHGRGDKKGVRFHRGVIAQEIESLFDTMEFSAVKHTTVKDENAFDEYSVGYTEFIAPLIRAVQELSAEVEELKAQING